MHTLKSLILIGSLLVLAGCSGSNQPASNATNGSAPTVAPATPGTSATPSTQKTTKATGTLTASPNPIKVCDGTGLGVTKLTWSAQGTYLVEVRIGSPSGGQFARTGGSGGTKETGKWAGKGSMFYLQDVADGKPLTPENTLAVVTVNSNNAGCP